MSDAEKWRARFGVPLARRYEPEAFRVFVRESNRIEGIKRVSQRELGAHAKLLNTAGLTVQDLQAFVAVIAPRKPLRDQPGLDVRVGNHLPPRGGPGIAGALGFILDNAMAGEDPYVTHVAYETLHPFMDGNGRSGRALWLWQMIRQREAHYALTMGFLHLFYYQTLQHAGPRRHNARDGATLQSDPALSPGGDR